jgi:hypothetical protein
MHQYSIVLLHSLGRPIICLPQMLKPRLMEFECTSRMLGDTTMPSAKMTRWPSSRLTFPAGSATITTHIEGVTGHTDGVADAAQGSGTGVSYATEEAGNDQNLVADPIHSSIDRPSPVQTDNTEGGVESGKAECCMDSACPGEGHAHLDVESQNISEISQGAAKVSSPNTAIDLSQLLPVRESSRSNESEHLKPLKSAFLKRLQFPLSTSTLDPRTAFLSPSFSAEATSWTTDQDVADSPPASLLQLVDTKNSIQALAAPPPFILSASALRPPTPNRERRCSDGFFTFASRSEVFRAMLPFRRRAFRTATPQSYHGPNSPSINSVSIEAVDENRIRDLPDTSWRRAEKPRWRKYLSAPFRRKREMCTCEAGHPSICKLHKKSPHQDSTPPRFRESLEGEPTHRLSDGSWILPKPDFSPDLESQLGQGAHANVVGESEDEIGVARPLGPENGVFAQSRRSEDINSEISELGLSNGSWHHVLRIRGGSPGGRVRFYHPQGHDAPINPWLWWFAGGRHLVRDSASITRGFLGNWRTRSARTDSGMPRGFGQEFVYTWSGGRWGSGRTRPESEGWNGMGTGSGTGMKGPTRLVAGRGGVTEPQLQGSAGARLEQCLASAPARAEAGPGDGPGDVPADEDAQVRGSLPHWVSQGGVEP